MCRRAHTHNANTHMRREREREKEKVRVNKPIKCAATEAPRHMHSVWFQCFPHQSHLILPFTFVHLIFVWLLHLLLLLLWFDTFPDSSYFRYKSSINAEKCNYCDKASNADRRDEKWTVMRHASSCHAPRQVHAILSVHSTTVLTCDRAPSFWTVFQEA